MSLNKQTKGVKPYVKSSTSSADLQTAGSQRARAEQNVSTVDGADAAEPSRSQALARSYLNIIQVKEHLGVARSTVEQLPEEILPFIDLSPSIERQLKRYHPDDVAAAPALIRAWKRAQQGRRGEAFLAVQRKLLEERDHAAIIVSRGRKAVAK